MKRQNKEASNYAHPSGLATLVNHSTLISVTQIVWKQRGVIALFKWLMYFNILVSWGQYFFPLLTLF